MGLLFSLLYGEEPLQNNEQKNEQRRVHFNKKASRRMQSGQGGKYIVVEEDILPPRKIKSFKERAQGIIDTDVSFVFMLVLTEWGNSHQDSIIGITITTATQKRQNKANYYVIEPSNQQLLEQCDILLEKLSTVQFYHFTSKAGRLVVAATETDQFIDINDVRTLQHHFKRVTFS